MTEPDRASTTRDATRMRDQPALRESTGLSWLIVSTITALLCVALLAVLMPVSAPLSIVGIIAIVIEFAAVLAIALFVRRRIRRLRLLAVALVALTITGLGLMVAMALAAIR